MQGFVFISNKNKKLNSPLERIKNQINNLKGIKHAFKVISDNNLTLIYYTNEFEDYPYINIDNILACPIGQFVNDKNQLIQNIISSKDDEKRNIISTIQGTFLLALGDLKRKRIDIFTHVTRIESAYCYESLENIVIGSDPIVVSALSNDKLTPEFDSSNFISFFELGYFADESTPYKNVICLPENSHIKFESNILSIVSNDESYSSIFQQDLDDHFISNLTEVFLNSLNTIPKDSKLTLGLTGGKDSRLIFTSLLKQGFDVETFTSGFPESPDVIIAKELAKYYGISHTTKTPNISNSKTIEIDLIKRLTDSMNATSGQIYAYENIHPLSNYKENITVNGVAGEVLRGGYIIPPNYSSKTDKENIIKKFYRYSNLYNDPINNYYNHLVNVKNDDDDYLVSLYKQYLKYKCGRWSSDSRQGKGYLAENYMPFLDNQLVKLVMKIKPENLYTGKLQFDLLKSVDNQSINFRFETSRFNFEKNAPFESDFTGWYKRRPLYPTSKIGKYNWRVLSNGQSVMINSFREILLSDLNNPIYDVVNKDKIDNILNNNIDYKYGRFIWALASMSTFINHIQSTKRSYVENKIKINLPSDEVKNINPKMKLISLNNYFESLNESLIISKSNRDDERNIRTLNQDKNPYIKTFRGKFDDVPSKNENAVLNQATKIRLNLTLDETDEHLVLYLILYSKKKKELKILNSNQKKLNNKIVFDEIVPLSNDIELYRLALKFPKKEKPINYRLKYSFVEIYYK